MATAAVADPITTEVIRNFVVSCAMDMNAALYRSAFSSVIYEGRDSAVALLDRSGQTLGQSTGVPIFVGNIDVCVKLAIARYGDSFAPGDIIMMNDPYVQGTHAHDVTVLGPIFYKGELVGFAASRAHWQDIGTIDPGSTMGSTSIYHEGLRLGPTRIVKGGKADQDWMDLIRTNVRLKDVVIGDLNAQIAAIRTGERRMTQMLDRVGIAVFESAKENIFKQSADLDRAAVAAIPDGVYTAEGTLDNDGVVNEPIVIKVSLTISGDKMTVDLAGTSGPVKGALNCGKEQTISMIRLAYKAMLSPNTPITGKSFPTLEVKIPDSCIFNAKDPAACEWYFSGLGLLADLIFTCLGRAMPEKAIAAQYGDSMVAAFVGADPRQGQWMAIEPTAGGWGAFKGSDGESALINLSNGSFRNIPTEVYEVKHSMQIEEFSIRRDSGGPGRWRGGCGVVRSYRALSDVDVSLWFERSTTPGWGLLGGKSGMPPYITVEGPGVRFSPLKLKAKTIPAGTVVKTMTGGGGGYGNALERPPEEVIDDIVDGFLTVEAAARDYGVVVDPRTLKVDEAKTRQARKQ